MILLMIHLLISLGTLLAHEDMEEIFWFFFKSGMQAQLGCPLINLLFVLSYLVKYVHNDPISYFSYLLFGKEF